MNDSVLIVERPDFASAVLTLNRPERRNALSVELMRALCEALDSLSAEPARRVVILRGAGPVFCAGLDLVEAAESDAAEQGAQWVARTLQTVASAPLVTVAAAHGGAYAGGAGLMACCDFVVAADDLRIGFPEVRRGLVPALVTAFLRERLRSSDLRELVLLGEPVDARRALSMGLVRRVVAADRLLDEAWQIAAAVLKGAPEAVRLTKQLLCESRRADFGPRLAEAMDLHKQARRSDEAREGLAAFHQRRPPNWPRPVE